MKWGVRRYQNKDGSLTPAGKKKISKQYLKVSQKVARDLNDNYQNMYMKAYNKSADEMDKGGIDRFNASQRKKYGDKYAERDGYEDDYFAEFDKVLTKNMNRSLNDFYSNNANYKKGKELVNKYGMTKWDDLARNNEDKVKSVRRAVEQGI